MQTWQNNQPIPRRASSRQAQLTRTTHAVPPTADEISDDERLYQPMHPGRSVLRHRTTEGYEVIQQGRRRYVLHPEPPPHRVHWLVPAGAGMLLLLLLLVGGNWVLTTWQHHQLDAQYGMPRTWQTDAMVGHHDSAGHPSHFTFENLGGHIIIIEIPGGDVAHARLYAGPILSGPGAATVPVTGAFQDTNGDGKPDLILHIGDQTFVYLNDGTEFKAQQ